jgi:drug/metabolite transporter (DMT)-like permease
LTLCCVFNSIQVLIYKDTLLYELKIFGVPSMKSISADFSLLVTGVIWGSGFIATHRAIEAHFSTSLILLFRFSLAAVVLFLFMYRRIISITKEEVKIGLLAGLLLFLAFYFQTLGLKYTIAYLEVASKKVDPIKLTFIQMSVATLASFIFFILFDKGSIGEADMIRGFFPIIYIGLVSTLIGFFIQTYAQKFTTASKTAIFLSSSLNSAFCFLAAFAQ